MAHENADGSIVIDTELDNDGFEKGADKLISSVSTLTRRMEAFGSEMRQAFAGITNLLQNLTTATRGAGASAETGTQQATQAAGAAQQAATATNAVTAATRNYDKELARLQKKIDTGKNDLAGYYQELAQIQQSTDLALSQTTTDKQASNVLEVEQVQIDTVNQKYAAKIATLQQLEAAYARVEAARDASNQPSLEPGEAPVNPAGGVSDVRIFPSLQAVMSQVGNAALSAGQNLLRMGFNVVASGARKAVSGLKSFVSQTKKASLTSNGLVKSLTSLKRLFATRIKRMFISQIFKSVQDGIKQLALYDSEFNTVMSNIKNSATQVGGDIAVAAGNLLSALEPAITTIINMLSTAVSYLNQFFALLNGKTTYTAAKKGAEQYADAASGAAAAQKALNKELYGFDEINRQSGESGGGGGGGGSSAIEYEEVPINFSSGVTDWVERLKTAWENSDWQGIGNVVADSLNAAITVTDDWINNTLVPLGIQWAGRAAEALNGFAAGFNWAQLGTLISDGLIGILSTINEFIYTVKWDELGTSISQNIIGMIQNIRWAELGHEISDLLIGVFGSLAVTIGSIDWDTLGKSIWQGLTDMLSNIDWGSLLVTLGGLIVNLFSGAVSLLLGFIGGIAGTLADVFNNIGWDGISGFFHGLSDSVTSFAKNLKSYVVDPIVNGIKSLLGIHSPSTVFAEIGYYLVAGLVNGIGDAWDGLMGYLSELVDNLIGSVLGWFGIHSPSKVFFAIGEYLDEGLRNGLTAGEGDLLSTASNIAAAVTDNMTPNSIDAQISADAFLSGMQLAITSLDSVAATFLTIADTLAGIGGLTMPQIAAGTVVPYQTKLAPSDYSYIDNRDINKEESLRRILREVLGAGNNDIIALLQELIDTVSHIKIGDEVIGKAATRYQRRVSRAGGY